MAMPSLKRDNKGTADFKSVGLNFTEVRIRNRTVINIYVIGLYANDEMRGNLLQFSFRPEFDYR